MISLKIIKVCLLLWMCSQTHQVNVLRSCANLVDTALQYFGSREPDVNFLAMTMLSVAEKRQVTFIVSYPDGTSNRRKSLELKYDETDKLGSLASFKKNMKTMVVMHGFLSKREFLADFETAVTGKQIILIGLDWSGYAGASAAEYGEIASRVGVIGELVGDFLFRAVRDERLSWEKLHLVGHSLGAQAAKHTAETLRRLYSDHKKQYMEHGVPLITALDPAQPGFKNAMYQFRLNDMDASRLEVIHTNTAKFGWKEPLGHLDLYINGMDIQPHCRNYAIVKRDICSHTYAHQLYRYIIQNDAKLQGYRATYDELKTKNLNYFTQKAQRNNADKIQDVYGNSITKTGIYFVPTNVAVETECASPNSN